MNEKHVEESTTEALSYDHAYDVVPINERNKPFGMGMLWLATQTSMGSLFAGFSAQQSGQSFKDLLIGCLIGVIGISIYGVLAGYLGAKTGRMQPFLARSIFGKKGSILVSFLLIIMGSGWYSFQAVYAGELVKGIIPSLTLSVVVLGVILTLLMAINNILGFKGIGTFGKFVAPIIFMVALYAIFKNLFNAENIIWATPKIKDTTSIMATATLILGLGVYGNEPDVWRFAKPNIKNVAFPMIIAYVVGLFVFPIAGWLMALNTSSVGPSQLSDSFMILLFNSVPLTVIVILISQFALNDINLYESINAMTNIFGFKRYYSIALLLFFGIIVSIWMATMKSTNAFFIVAGIGASTVPTATTIMAIDTLIIPKLFGLKRDLSKISGWATSQATNWVAVTSLIIGVFISIILSIPGNVLPNIGLSVGLAPFEGWVSAVISYLVLFSIELKFKKVNQTSSVSDLQS